MRSSAARPTALMTSSGDPRIRSIRYSRYSRYSRDQNACITVADANYLLRSVVEQVHDVLMCTSRSMCGPTRWTRSPRRSG
jgi:hypothetical protein